MHERIVHQPLGTPPSHPEEPSRCPAEAWSRSRSLSATSPGPGSCGADNKAGLALGVGASQGCPLLLGTRSEQFPGSPAAWQAGVVGIDPPRGFVSTGGWAGPPRPLAPHVTPWQRWGQGAALSPREELASEQPSPGVAAAEGSGAQKLRAAGGVALCSPNDTVLPPGPESTSGLRRCCQGKSQSLHQGGPCPRDQRSCRQTEPWMQARREGAL